MDAGNLWVGEVILAAGLAPEVAGGAQGRDEDHALDPTWDLTYALCNSINPSQSPLEDPALQVGLLPAQLPVHCQGNQALLLLTLLRLLTVTEKKCTEW